MAASGTTNQPLTVASTLREAWSMRRVWWFTATARTRARFARTLFGSFKEGDEELDFDPLRWSVLTSNPDNETMLRTLRDTLPLLARHRPADRPPLNKKFLLLAWSWSVAPENNEAVMKIKN